MRVIALDQVDLPVSHVVLQRFLALDCGFDFGERLGLDQQFHAIPARVSRAGTFAMGFDTAEQVVGDADVERTVGLARQNVDSVGEPGHLCALRHSCSVRRDGFSRQARE